jgi:hypothetical protein
MVKKQKKVKAKAAPAPKKKRKYTKRTKVEASQVVTSTLQPFTETEAKDIMLEVEKLFALLVEKYGDERMDSYAASMFALVHPDGILTNLRGNMNVSQFAMANIVSFLVTGISDTLPGLTREVALLSCVTELAAEVRRLWAAESPSPEKV